MKLNRETSETSGPCRDVIRIDLAPVTPDTQWSYLECVFKLDAGKFISQGRPDAFR